jgi:ring-1,2-phenylacetyl-CoA epoxidase subunit PaaE
MSLRAFNKLPVVAVHREIEDAVIIELEIPDNLHEKYHFKPGQYLTLRRDIQDEDVRRCYSICSAGNNGYISVAVKKLKDGIFSSWANEVLKIGDTIETMPPAGKFIYEQDNKGLKRYVCVAAGSGITPIMSMISSILDREVESTVTLVYGNQRVSSILFRDKLEQLKNQYLSRLQLVHVLSQESRESPLLCGRITYDKLSSMTPLLFDIATIDEFFLCGPEMMTNQLLEGLVADGIAKEKIKRELFVSSSLGLRGKADDISHNGGREAISSRVGVILDGRQVNFDMNRNGLSVLDQALLEGIDLPFACKGGVCGTCRAKLVKGKVIMAGHHALLPEEIAGGYILSCQAQPISDDVQIDFDRAL